jgi:putative Mg2+ transporter-C (MgtC) family protein
MLPEPLKQELFFGLDDPDHLVRVLVRLVVAGALGGILGYERQKEGKAAGLRTHMLVALGAALFVITPVEAGLSLDQLSRVVQGLTMGIGFLGGGAILKLTSERKIQGLTTAANLWVAAATGMAVGFGLFWPPVIVVLLVWLILFTLGRLEAWLGDTKRQEP